MVDGSVVVEKVVVKDRGQSSNGVNRREFLGAAAATLAGACFSSNREAKANEFPPSGAEREKLLVELAKTDHIRLLKLCEEHCIANFKDYTGILVSQERIGDELKPARTAQFKFLRNPDSVLLHYLENAPSPQKFIYTEKILYSAGQNGGNMLVLPRVEIGGKSRLTPVVERDPGDREVSKSSLRRIDEFGFHNTLHNVRKVYEEANGRGELLKYGLVQTEQRKNVEGEGSNRPVITIGRKLPDDPRYPAALTIMDLDLEWLVPVRTVGYNGANQLIFMYQFSDLKFNQGLTAADFVIE